MKKIIFSMILFFLIASACKKDKNESENLSCDELKKRMDQKGDQYDPADRSTCTAYVDAIRAYAKAECLSNETNFALENLAASITLLCQ